MAGRIKLGVVGAGARGHDILKLVADSFHDVEIAAVCDNYGPFLARAEKSLSERGVAPRFYADYGEMLDREELGAVLVISSWDTHIPFAIEALERGIPCGMEVCGAYDVKQCWDLVGAYERTHTPFMFLENCCYGRTELMVLNMVRQGVLGEIVHCDGAYAHDLRDEIVGGKLGHHYRYREYLHRDCDNYPTHELGPIAKVLNINRGNRFVSLSSFASKSAGMGEYIREHHPDDGELMSARFAQGDVVTTVIRCAGGETVTLTLDTTLPRYYSRNFCVHGTRGLYDERNDSFAIDGEFEHSFDWKTQWGNAERYREKYEHPIWRRFLEGGILGGHGGMDGLCYGAFFDAVENGYDMPIDVYDAAAWMSVTALSAESIALGDAPVAFPDYTGGSWQSPRPPVNPGAYSLE